METGASYSRASRESSKGTAAVQCRVAVAGLSVRAWQTRDGASSVTVRAFTRVRRTASGMGAGPGTGYTCHSRCKAGRPDFIEGWQETSHASALLLSLQSAVAARHPSHSYIDDKNPHLSSFISQLEATPSLSSLNSISSSPEITDDRDRRGATPSGFGSERSGTRMETDVGHSPCAQAVPCGGRASRGCSRGFESPLRRNWQFAVLIAEWAEGKPCGRSGAQENAATPERRDKPPRGVRALRRLLLKSRLEAFLRRRVCIPHLHCVIKSSRPKVLLCP